MKWKILVVCALLAFFLGIGLLIVAWNGNFKVTGAWPISSRSVELNGSASGWRAMAGLAGIVAAPVLFLWGLISLATGRPRKAPTPAEEEQAFAPPADNPPGDRGSALH
jgi:TRAP-type C4-dicarboxylate transport system permease small subunit